MKKQKRKMPTEIITREEYVEWMDSFKDVHSLLGSMNYSPEATRINDLQKRVKKIIDKNNW